MLSVVARFANEGENLGEGYDKVQTEAGYVYLPKTGVRYAERLALGFSRFLGNERITVMGALPAKKA